jgi:signal transduction histidine kinase
MNLSMTKEHSDGNQNKPQLRLTGSLSDEDVPDGADAPFLATRLGVLTHELAGLLDGSMRCLGIARRSLATDAPSGVTVQQQLQTIQGALERMAGLVHAAMQGAGTTIGSSAVPSEPTVTLADALEHAIAVLSPMAQESRVELVCTLAPEASAYETGPVYAVVLNSIRNAVEAVASAGAGGKVEIDVSFRAGSPDVFELRVVDDGPGLAPACEDGRAFIIGLSTKPGGSGIGLCLAAHVIGQLGGRITLETREPERSDGRRGAVLKATWPAGRVENTGAIG